MSQTTPDAEEQQEEDILRDRPPCPAARRVVDLLQVAARLDHDLVRHDRVGGDHERTDHPDGAGRCERSHRPPPAARRQRAVGEEHDREREEEDRRRPARLEEHRHLWQRQVVVHAVRSHGVGASDARQAAEECREHHRPADRVQRSLPHEDVAHDEKADEHEQEASPDTGREPCLPGERNRGDHARGSHHHEHERDSRRGEPPDQARRVRRRRDRGAHDEESIPVPSQDRYGA